MRTNTSQIRYYSAQDTSYLKQFLITITPLFLIIIATVVVYYPSLHYEFQFDDLPNIVKCYTIRHGSFTSLFLSGSRWISYWLNTIYYNYTQYNPFLYRLGNLIIHCANGALLYGILFFILKNYRSLTQAQSVLSSTVVSILFLLHPSQTQTVSYVIQGQLEGLALFCILSSLTCFLALVTSKTIQAKAFLTMLLIFITCCSVGTKEISIITPALVLLVDWFFIAQGSVTSLKKRLWLHCFLSMIVMFMFIYIFTPSACAQLMSFNFKHSNITSGNSLTLHSHDTITRTTYALSQFKVILHYLYIFLWPFSMSIDYDWKLSQHFTSYDVFLPCTILLLILGYSTLRLRRCSYDIVSFGLLWFFIYIIPRASIIPTTELLADYKTYGASIGVFVTITYLLSTALYTQLKNKKYLNRVILSIICSLTICLASATFLRNRVWSSGETLWLDVIRKAPARARAYNNYAVALIEQKRYKEALKPLECALSLEKNYFDACNNLAIAHQNLGNIQEAALWLQKAIEIQPFRPEAYNNLGALLIPEADYACAQEALERAIKLRPHYGKAYYNLGKLHSAQGNNQEAYVNFKKACLEADLDNETGFMGYATISFLLQKHNEAIKAYEKALTFNPQSIPALVGLASTYMLIQEYSKAQTIYKHAYTLAPNNTEVVQGCAEALFASHSYPQALKLYHQLLQLHYVPEAYLRIAACLSSLGRLSEAIIYLNHLIKLNPSPNLIQQAQNALATLSKIYPA
jgi:protein O-mannosyl-transferase